MSRSKQWNGIIVRKERPGLDQRHPCQKPTLVAVKNRTKHLSPLVQQKVTTYSRYATGAHYRLFLRCFKHSRFRAFEVQDWRVPQEVRGKTTIREQRKEEQTHQYQLYLSINPNRRQRANLHPVQRDRQEHPPCKRERHRGEAAWKTSTFATKRRREQ